MDCDNAIVLVVDDDPCVVELLSRILGYEGYQVSKAASSQQALRIVDDQTPDVVIVDWMMPDIDGLALCRMFRAKPQAATVPIIMISADDGVRAICREAGADAWLTKPFDVDYLLACVHGLLARRAGPNEVTSWRPDEVGRA